METASGIVIGGEGVEVEDEEGNGGMGLGSVFINIKGLGQVL